MKEYLKFMKLKKGEMNMQSQQIERENVKAV